MTNEEIEQHLKDTIELEEVHVTSDGSHFHIIGVSDLVDEMSRIKRQQLVYGSLKDKIADGSMHAVSIKTFNKAQWQREKLFNMPQ